MCDVSKSFRGENVCDFVRRQKKKSLRARWSRDCEEVEMRWDKGDLNSKTLFDVA